MCIFFVTSARHLENVSDLSSDQGAEDYALSISPPSALFFSSQNADYLHIISPRTVFYVFYIFSYNLRFLVFPLCVES